MFGDEVAQRGVAFLDRRAGLEVGGGFGVETLQRKGPAGYLKKNATKRLAAIAKLAFEVISKDPSRPAYRQGNTLGDEHRDWFLARFFQQYRLFFRIHAQAKVIVYAWVNDEDTKRRLRKPRRRLPGLSQDARQRSSALRLESTSG